MSRYVSSMLSYWLEFLTHVVLASAENRAYDTP